MKPTLFTALALLPLAVGCKAPPPSAQVTRPGVAPPAAAPQSPLIGSWKAATGAAYVINPDGTLLQVMAGTTYPLHFRWKAVRDSVTIGAITYRWESSPDGKSLALYQIEQQNGIPTGEVAQAELFFRQ